MRVIRIGLLGALLCAGAAATDAATYIAAPSGRYGNDGTLQSPWNLERAADTAAAGDTVELRGGVYAAVLHPRNGGTAERPLVFRAYRDERPLLAGVGADDRPVEISTDHVTLDGLAVKKSATGRGKQFNILISGDHATVRNCAIIGSSAAEDRRNGSSESGIRVLKPSVGAVIEDCEIAGLSHVGIHVGDGARRVVIRRNRIHDHYLDAVRFDHSLGLLRESLVEDNWLYGSLASDGIQFNGDFGATSYPRDESNCGTVVRGNRIHSNAENGIDLKGTCSILIERNVIYANRGDNDGIFDATPTCGTSSNDRCGGIGGIMRGGGQTSRDVIIRRNVVYDNRGGIALLGNGWVVYGNTIIANNRDYTGPASSFRANDRPYFIGLAIGGPYDYAAAKNNLIGGHADVEVRASGSDIAVDIDGNVYFDESPPRFSYRSDPWLPVAFDDWRRALAGWSRVFGDDGGSRVVSSPGLVQVPADPVAGGAYDFAPVRSSPIVDAGVALTSTLASGFGDVVAVENARYFTDGMQIVEGDRIRIDGTGLDVLVAAVDYARNRLTLDRPLSWQAGAGVHLAHAGDGPDVGAFEYGGGEGQAPAEASCDDSIGGTAAPGCGGVGEPDEGGADDGDGWNEPGHDGDIGAAGFVAASAELDIYHAEYGRFDLTLANDPASTSPLTRAVLSVTGTAFDALDTSSTLSLIPSSLGSNNGVTSRTATIELDPGLAPGQSTTGRAGDLDPYAMPTGLAMTVTYANGSALAADFVRDGQRWTWSGATAGPAPEVQTIEAETMTLDGYSVENGNRIRLTRPCCEGTAAVRFDGAAGRYDLRVFGVSETDGPARVAIAVNGSIRGEYVFGVAPAASEFVVADLPLTTGDLIEIIGTYGNGAFARIDRLELRRW